LRPHNLDARVHGAGTQTSDAAGDILLREQGPGVGRVRPDVVQGLNRITKNESLLAGSRASLTSTSLKSQAGELRPPPVTIRFCPTPTDLAAWLFSALHRRTVGFQSQGTESSSVCAPCVPSPASKYAVTFARPASWT
jgi:hypothetical protein